jgi:hypothetical protein
MFLLAQKMTHVDLQEYALSLFITRTQFTLEKKKQKSWQFLSQCIHFPRMLSLVVVLFLPPTLFFHGLCHGFMMLVILYDYYVYTQGQDQ